MKAVFLCLLTLAFYSCSKADKVSPECAKKCAKNGECVLVEGECRATSDERCKQSDLCRYGGCHAVEGRCKAKSEEDCLTTDACKEIGGCTFYRDRGECLPSEERHCLKSTFCDDHGWCGLRAVGSFFVCAPTTGYHCVSSSDCKKFGKCGLKEKWCEPTEEAHCKSSSTCTGSSFGTGCELVDGYCR